MRHQDLCRRLFTLLSSIHETNLSLFFSTRLALSWLETLREGKVRPAIVTHNTRQLYKFTDFFYFTFHFNSSRRLSGKSVLETNSLRERSREDLRSEKLRRLFREKAVSGEKSLESSVADCRSEKLAVLENVQYAHRRSRKSITY